MYIYIYIDIYIYLYIYIYIYICIHICTSVYTSLYGLCTYISVWMWLSLKAVILSFGKTIAFLGRFNVSGLSVPC